MTVAAAHSTRATQRPVAQQLLAQPQQPLAPPAVPPGPLLHRRAPSAAIPALQPPGPPLPSLPRRLPNRAARPAMQQAHAADHDVLPQWMPSRSANQPTKFCATPPQAQHLPSRGAGPCTETRRPKPYAQERNSRGQLRVPTASSCRVSWKHWRCARWKQRICPRRGREGARRHLRMNSLCPKCSRAHAQAPRERLLPRQPPFCVAATQPSASELSSPA